MVKVSKRYVDPEDFGHYVNNLWTAFTLMDSKEDIRLLFKDLFTHTEYKMFAKRLEIARRLLVGQTYGGIGEKLKVTSRTINSISNILTLHGDGLRKADKKLRILEKQNQSKREERQDRIEGRVRKKMLGETVLPDLLAEGLAATGRAVSKSIKYRSAKRKLSI